MSDRLRRAGRGSLADGTTVVWSVAEGTRGRRWREVRTGPEGVISSLLLETDPARAFAHLELATAAGLLTLHPEPDATLHGNVVTADGIRHVVGRSWPAGSALVVDGSPIAAAAATWAAPSTDRAAGPALVVTLSLELVDGTRHASSVAIDDAGLPVLGDARSWPLEGSDG